MWLWPIVVMAYVVMAYVLTAYCSYGVCSYGPGQFSVPYTKAYMAHAVAQGKVRQRIHKRRGIDLREGLAGFPLQDRPHRLRIFARLINN